MDLNQVTFTCVDYSASVSFYKKLGFRQIVDNSPQYARFETAFGTTFSIHSVDSAAKDSKIIVYFEVDDVDAAVDQLRRRGIEFDAEPVDQEWLWREAYLRDPAGNTLCIYHAGPNRRYPPWRVEESSREYR